MVAPLSDNYFKLLLKLHDWLELHDQFSCKYLRRLLCTSPVVKENEGQSKCGECSENCEQIDNDKASKLYETS